MARYRKVDSRIWNDEKFRDLSDDGQLLFLFLLTHPHQTALGAMRATVSGLAEEKGWLPERLSEAFAEALSRGMVKHDARASCVWLPNFLKYNRPESPNVVKAWGSAADLIPECSLKGECIQAAKAFLKGFKEAFRKAFTEVFGEALAKDYALSGAGAGAVTGTGSEEGKPPPSKRTEPNTGPRWDDLAQRVVERGLEIYPQKSGRVNWITAAKYIANRLQEGATVDQLIAAMERYRAHVDAAVPNRQYVLDPANFFSAADKPWIQAWDVPRTRGEAQQDANLDAARDWLAQGNSK
jgi:hypothetical protein